MKKLALLLALAGCEGPERVQFKPDFACQDYIKCHILSWRIGFPSGPQVGGFHIECRCTVDRPQKEGGYTPP